MAAKCGKWLLLFLVFSGVTACTLATPSATESEFEVNPFATDDDSNSGSDADSETDTHSDNESDEAEDSDNDSDSKADSSALDTGTGTESDSLTGTDTAPDTGTGTGAEVSTETDSGSDSDAPCAYTCNAFCDSIGGNEMVGRCEIEGETCCDLGDTDSHTVADTSTDTETGTGTNTGTDTETGIDTDTGTGVVTDTDTVDTDTVTDTDTVDTDTVIDTGTVTDTDAVDLYLFAGDWAGYGWTSTGTTAGGTISELTGEKTIGTDEVCVTGSLLADYGSLGGVGMTVNESKEGPPDAWLPGTEYTGVQVSVSSSTSAEIRVEIIGEDDNSYCFSMDTTTRTVSWSEFATDCWGTSGVAYDTTVGIVKFQVYAAGDEAAGAQNFDYCIDELYPVPASK